MRRTGEWMTLLDERILEYLAAEGWSTPRIMAQEGLDQASQARIQERLDTLANAELAAPLFEGSEMWGLTIGVRDT